ncbi:MAG: GNAT family N-acetyltransferase [Ornithinimicrobium sp.]
MVRSVGAARALRAGDRDWALSVCARDPVLHVFVAARILEGGLANGRAAVFAHDRGRTPALCWSAANVVPVEGNRAAIAALAERVSTRRKLASSLFGPAEQVQQMWSQLSASWGPAREIRLDQPVLTMKTLPSGRGSMLDPAVRLGRLEELDVVTPAAEAMFTEEIGYPPYRGSGSAYRSAVAGLLRANRTLIRTEDRRVVFKADLGSVALGVAQIQGVWVHPDYRGQGLAVPAMASVIEHTLRHVAPTVTLYVNDYNAAALATYRRVGMRQTGSFSTILL